MKRCWHTFNVDGGMTNRIYRTVEAGNPIIHIIGKLDSTAILSEFLREIYNNYQKGRKISQHQFQILVDLKETELITEPCLEILKDYSAKCRISFRNYSLYVELLLFEYGFLSEEKID